MTSFAAAPKDIAPARQTYYRGLDGLRGMAIIIVLFEHFWTYKSVLPVGGEVGVDIFFVISGFLITEILLRQRGKPIGPSLRRFWSRRVLRIFPAYYLYLLVLAVVGAPRALELMAWLLTYSLNIHTAVTGDVGGRLLSHLWSLCVEEQFYLVWPVVALAASDRWLKRILVLAPLAAVAFRIYVIHSLAYGGEIAYRATPAALDALGFGAAIAYGKAMDARWYRQLVGSRRAILSLLVVSTLASVILFHGGAGWAPVAGRLAFSLLGASLILAIISGNCPHVLRRFFESATMRGIGLISYGLYVYHLLAEFFLAPALQRWMVHEDFLRLPLLEYNQYLLTMPVYVAAALIMAIASYFVVERPILGLKNKLAFD